MAVCNIKMEQKPEGTHTDIFDLCCEVSQGSNEMDELTLATEVYKALAAKYRDGGLAEAMSEMGVGTREELLQQVQMFISWRTEHPFSSKDEDDLACEQPEGNFPVREQISQSSINDTTLFVIDNVVKRTRVTDRYDVMEHMCDVLEHRFGTGAKLEENLKKMHLATTKEVLTAIDIYFTMKTLYPDTVFGRKRMQTVWDPVFDECLPVEGVS